MEVAVQQLVYYLINVAQNLQHRGLNHKDIERRLHTELAHFHTIQGFVEEFRLTKLIAQHADNCIGDNIKLTSQALSETSPVDAPQLSHDIDNAIGALCSNPRVKQVERDLIMQVTQALEVLMDKLARAADEEKPDNHQKSNTRLAFASSGLKIPHHIMSNTARSEVSNRSDNFSTMSFSSIPPYENIRSLAASLTHADETVRRDALHDLCEFQPGDLLSSPDWREVKDALSFMLGDEHLRLAHQSLQLHVRLFQSAVPSVQTGEIYINLCTFLLRTFTNPTPTLRLSLQANQLPRLMNAPLSTKTLNLAPKTKSEATKMRLHHLLDVFRFLLYMANEIVEFWMYFPDDMTERVVNLTIAIFSLEPEGAYMPLTLLTAIDPSMVWWHKWMLSFKVRGVILRTLLGKSDSRVISEFDYEDEDETPAKRARRIRGQNEQKVCRTLVQSFIRVHLTRCVQFDASLKQLADVHDEVKDAVSNVVSEEELSFVTLLGSVAFIGDLVQYEQFRRECFPVRIGDHVNTQEHILGFFSEMFVQAAHFDATTPRIRKALKVLLTTLGRSFAHYFVARANMNTIWNASESTLLSTFVMPLMLLASDFVEHTTSHTLGLHVFQIILSALELIVETRIGKEMVCALTLSPDTSFFRACEVIIAKYTKLHEHPVTDDNKAVHNLVQKLLTVLNALFRKASTCTVEAQRSLRIVCASYTRLLDNKQCSVVVTSLLNVMMSGCYTPVGIQTMAHSLLDNGDSALQHVIEYIWSLHQVQRRVEDTNPSTRFFSHAPFREDETKLTTQDGLKARLHQVQFKLILGRIASHPLGFQHLVTSGILRTLLETTLRLLEDPDLKLAWALSERFDTQLWTLDSLSCMLYSASMAMTLLDERHDFTRNLSLFIQLTALFAPMPEFEDGEELFMAEMVRRHRIMLTSIDAHEVGLRVLDYVGSNLSTMLVLQSRLKWYDALRDVENAMEVDASSLEEGKTMVISDAAGELRRKLLKRWDQYCQLPEGFDVLTLNQKLAQMSAPADEIVTVSALPVADMREVVLTLMGKLDGKNNKHEQLTQLALSSIAAHTPLDATYSLAASDVLASCDITEGIQPTAELTIAAVAYHGWVLVSSLRHMVPKLSPTKLHHLWLHACMFVHSTRASFTWSGGAWWLLCAMGGAEEQALAVWSTLQTGMQGEMAFLEATNAVKLQCVEELVERCLPQVFGVFQCADFSLTQYVQHWLHEGFFRVVSPAQCMLMSIVPVLYGADYQVYLCVALLRHMQQVVGLKRLRMTCFPDGCTHTALGTAQWPDFRVVDMFDYCNELREEFPLPSLSVFRH